MAIEGPTGRPLWARDHGGAGGVAVSSGNVFVTDNKGGVFGLDKASGAAMWSQTALARRSLTGPALQGDYVVVGDYKGYVHWLQTSDGAMAARARAVVMPCWPSRSSQTGCCWCRTWMAS